MRYSKEDFEVTRVEILVGKQEANLKDDSNCYRFPVLKRYEFHNQEGVSDETIIEAVKYMLKEARKERDRLLAVGIKPRQ